MAANAWRGRISPQIDQLCPMCEDQEKETVLHCFWSCLASQTLWTHTTDLLNYLAPPGNCQTWSTPAWSQSLFTSSVPRRFTSISQLWSLLQGITLWCIWIAKNHCVFHQGKWRDVMVFNLIWSGLIEYACTAWLKTLRRITKEPSHIDCALKKFDADWRRFPSLCIRNGLIVSWDHCSQLTGIG
jgi:hypothetical protein